MKVKINAEDLLAILNKVKFIAKIDKACPVLSFGVFKTCENELHITIANRINYAVVRIPAEIEEPGECLIEIGKFVSIISTLSKQITIQTKESVVWIKKDSSKCKLETRPIEDYPTSLYNISNPTAEFDMSALELADGFKKVMKFANDDGILGCVNLRISNKIIKIAATDGGALGCVMKAIEDENTVVDICLPIDSVNNLLPVITCNESVHIKLDSSRCLFKISNIEFCTRLLDAQYPQYEGLLPQTSAVSFKLDKAELKNVLERINIVECKNDRLKSRVSFHLKGGLLTIEANQSKSNDVLIAEDKLGDDITFILSRVYLYNVLNSLSRDKVEFRLNNPGQAVMFDEMENRYLVMPMA